MFGLIADIFNLPQRTVEWLDDELGLGLTHPRRKRAALKRYQELKDSGLTDKQALSILKDEI